MTKKLLSLFLVTIFCFNLFNFQVSAQSTIQPLVPDVDHHVVVLPECDLAMKFNKDDLMLSNQKLPETNFVFDSTEKYQDSKEYPMALTITCRKEKLLSDTDISSFFGPLNENPSQQTVIKGLEGENLANFKQNLYGNGNSEFYFHRNGIYYKVYQVLRSGASSNNTYTLQFNSLAPSKSSIVVFPPFTDVDQKNPFALNIQNLKDKNIVSGYEDKTFKPEKPVTRGEMAKFLVNGFKLNSERISCNDNGNNLNTSCAFQYQFTDKNHNSTFDSYINQLKYNNISDGYPDGTFRPDQNITRGEGCQTFSKNFGK